MALKTKMSGKYRSSTKKKKNGPDDPKKKSQATKGFFKAYHDNRYIDDKPSKGVTKAESKRIDNYKKHKESPRMKTKTPLERQRSYNMTRGTLIREELLRKQRAIKRGKPLSGVKAPAALTKRHNKRK